MAQTLQDLPLQSYNAFDSDVFESIKQIVLENKENLKETLSAYLDEVSPVLTKRAFLDDDYSYSRHVLGKCPETGIEVMIGRWNDRQTSSIHGHPEYVFYKVLKGEMLMDFYTYDRQQNSLAWSHEQGLATGECVDSWGKEDRFDNMIHKVTAQDECLSLHVFVGDPLRGAVYDESKIAS